MSELYSHFILPCFTDFEHASFSGRCGLHKNSGTCSKHKTDDISVVVRSGRRKSVCALLHFSQYDVIFNQRLLLNEPNLPVCRPSSVGRSQDNSSVIVRDLALSMLQHLNDEDLSINATPT